ncbi:hypothetical protein WN944_027090 [Citrus x changshan-huyou]|uniref:Uncharacterized protein n=1 Tax=Citrus x changshan-huyou TaxID=2935761 RepID=A0AAP0Q9J3_9ROSI
MGLVAGVRRGLRQWQSTTTQKSHWSILDLVLVVNNSSSETPCWVNSSAIDSKAAVNGVGRRCEERTPAVAKHHHQSPVEP